METDIHSSCKELEKMLIDDFENLVARLLSGDKKSLIIKSANMSRYFAEIVSMVCFLNYQLNTYLLNNDHCDKE